MTGVVNGEVSMVEEVGVVHETWPAFVVRCVCILFKGLV